MAERQEKCERNLKQADRERQRERQRERSREHERTSNREQRAHISSKHVNILVSVPSDTVVGLIVNRFYNFFLFNFVFSKFMKSRRFISFDFYVSMCKCTNLSEEKEKRINY